MKYCKCFSAFTTLTSLLELLISTCMSVSCNFTVNFKLKVNLNFCVRLSKSLKWASVITCDDTWYPATNQRLNCSFQWNSPQGYTPEAQQKIELNLPTKSSGEQFFQSNKASKLVLVQEWKLLKKKLKCSWSPFWKFSRPLHDCWHFIVFFYPGIALHSESKSDGTFLHS